MIKTCSNLAFKLPRDVAATSYAVVFFNRSQQPASYMVSQNPRKCRASFVANVAKSVAKNARVFGHFQKCL
jgi:hypothetical protein